MSARYRAAGPRRGNLGTTVRIVWRTHRRGILIWVIALAASMIGTAAAVAGLYNTPAKIHTYAEAVTSGGALAAINGHVEGIDSLGGVIQDGVGFVGSFLLRLLGIGPIAGTTRCEEESGRLETSLVGPMARWGLLGGGGAYAVLAALSIGVPSPPAPLFWRVFGGAVLGAAAGVFAALAISDLILLVAGGMSLVRSRRAA